MVLGVARDGHWSLTTADRAAGVVLILLFKKYTS